MPEAGRRVGGLPATSRCFDRGVIIALADRRPVLDPTAWVAPNATVAGDVTLGASTGIWYGTVVRADMERIAIGARTNIQDGSTLHADPGFPLVLGEGVSVGHRAVLHGATIEDDVLVGMGAVVMNGARIGAGSIIGAGAVVPEGMQVPPRSLVVGLPAKVRKELGEEALDGIRLNAAVYVDLAAQHADAEVLQP